MSIYYIEDENGEFYSEDRTRRFSRLRGKAAYDFFQTPEGKEKVFMPANDAVEDGEEEIKIEVPKERETYFLQAKYRKRYVAETKQECNILLISGSEIINEGSDGEEITLEDSLIDKSANTEEWFCKRADIETLYKAIETLTEQERELIELFFFIDTPITERQYANLKGISNGEAHNRKIDVLEKIKKFFNFQ